MNKNVKIVLINPPSIGLDDDRVEPPLGLLYIAATAIKKGFENISFYDMSGCDSQEEIYEKIKNIPEGQVYGITSFCTNYSYAKECIKAIKSNWKNSYIIFGGVNASAMPKFILQDSKVDVVLTGEGEDAFVEILTSYITGNKLSGIVNGHGRKNIDSYAFPARQLVDNSSYSRRLMGEPVLSILSSRGCTHQCIHCNSLIMGGGSKTVRYRSGSNVEHEIRLLREQFKYFRFNDDHFTGNPNLEDLLEKITTLDIQFRTFARIEDLNSKTSQLLKKAGCIHTSVGLESINPKNLIAIGKAKQIGQERNVKIAQDNGLIIRASFMVGLPFDSDSSIEHFFSEVAKLGIDEFAIYPLIPYPGTLIAKNPEKFGYKITNPDFSNYFQIGKNRKTCYPMEHKNFEAVDIQRWMKMATEILETEGVTHISKSIKAT